MSSHDLSRPMLKSCTKLFSLALVMALCLIPACQQRIEPSATPGPTTRPQPVEPQAQADELPQLPDPGVLASLEAARRRVDVSRRYSLPRRWSCSKQDSARLAKPKLHKSLLKASDALGQERWEADALLRQRVPHDLAYWQKIRWGYSLRGVCHAERFVTQGIVEASFFGEPLNVHVAAAPVLAQIEDRLARSTGGTPTFSSVSAFVARTVRGPFKASKKLSNHAFGLAIDLDPQLNPYLSRKELALVEQLTGVRIKRSASIDAGARWDNFKKAEALFLERAGPWLKKQRADLAKASRPRARRLRKKIDDFEKSRNLSRALERGFLSHPRHFVVEMEASGFTWCTDFGPGADLMHYELRGQRP